MTHPFMEPTLAVVTGVGLGLLYFGGLWGTVRLLPSVRYPSLLFLGSWFLRVGLVLVVLFVGMEGRWQRAILGLIGFVLTRLVLTFLAQPRFLTFRGGGRESSTTQS